MRGAFLALALLPLASMAHAQVAETVVEYDPITAEERAELVTPELAFEADRNHEKNFDKYFFFHRSDTSLEEAFADISECDALSSGLSTYRSGSEPYPGYYAGQYGIGGVLGAAIGQALANAIFGSAQKREARRINMRNCMGFKGYDRYGLPKDMWREFHFEEGHGREEEAARRQALMTQALVASGRKPQQEVLQP